MIQINPCLAASIDGCRAPVDEADESSGVALVELVGPDNALVYVGQPTANVTPQRALVRAAVKIYRSADVFQPMPECVAINSSSYPPFPADAPNWTYANQQAVLDRQVSPYPIYVPPLP